MSSSPGERPNYTEKVWSANYEVVRAVWAKLSLWQVDILGLKCSFWVCREVGRQLVFCEIFSWGCQPEYYDFIIFFVPRFSCWISINIKPWMKKVKYLWSCYCHLKCISEYPMVFQLITIHQILLIKMLVNLSKVGQALKLD